MDHTPGAVIDHTLTNSYSILQKSIVSKTDIPLCAIAAYEMEVERKNMNLPYYTEEQVVLQFEKMAKRGVDLVTVYLM